MQKLLKYHNKLIISRKLEFCEKGGPKFSCQYIYYYFLKSGGTNILLYTIFLKSGTLLTPGSAAPESYLLMVNWEQISWPIIMGFSLQFLRKRWVEGMHENKKRHFLGNKLFVTCTMFLKWLENSNKNLSLVQKSLQTVTFFYLYWPAWILSYRFPPTFVTLTEYKKRKKKRRAEGRSNKLFVTCTVFVKWLKNWYNTHY